MKLKIFQRQNVFLDSNCFLKYFWLFSWEFTYFLSFPIKEMLNLYEISLLFKSLLKCESKFNLVNNILEGRKYSKNLLITQKIVKIYCNIKYLLWKHLILHLIKIYFLGHVPNYYYSNFFISFNREIITIVKK